MNSNVIYEPSQTTHWKNLFAQKTMLLGSHNLNPGEELVLQIQSVAINDIKNQNGKNEKVPVIQFHNAPPMVLNITNTKTIAALYGELYDRWTGCYIQVYAADIKVKGEKMTALRVRPKPPVVDQDCSQYEAQINSCQSLQELQKVFMSLPKNLKAKLTPLKNQMKEMLSA